MMDYRSLIDSFRTQKRGSTQVSYTPVRYTVDELARRGLKWDPTLKLPLRVQCSCCLTKLDGSLAEIDTVHYELSRQCSLARIWRTIMQSQQTGSWDSIAAEDIEDVHNACLETFTRTKSKKRSCIENPNVPSPEVLARNGFFYHPETLNDDRCTCVYCEVHLDQFDSESETDLVASHLKASPDCWYFLTKETNLMEQESVIERRTERLAADKEKRQMQAGNNNKEAASLIPDQYLPIDEIRGFYKGHDDSLIKILSNSRLVPDSSKTVKCLHCDYTTSIDEAANTRNHILQSPGCHNGRLVHALALFGNFCDSHVESEWYKFWQHQDKFFGQVSSSDVQKILRLTFPQPKWCDNPKAPSSTLLNKNGFFYANKSLNDDTCRCLYCGINLSDWTVGDENEIKDNHLSQSGHCYIHKYYDAHTSAQHTSVDSYHSGMTGGLEADVEIDAPDFGYPQNNDEDEPHSDTPVSTPPTTHNGNLRSKRSLRVSAKGTSDDPIDIQSDSLAGPIDSSQHNVDAEELHFEVLEDKDANIELSSEIDDNTAVQELPTFPIFRSEELDVHFSDFNVAESKMPKTYFSSRRKKPQHSSKLPGTYSDSENFESEKDVPVSESENAKENVVPHTDDNNEGNDEVEIPQVDDITGPLDDSSINQYHDATDVNFVEESQNHETTEPVIEAKKHAPELKTVEVQTEDNASEPTPEMDNVASAAERNKAMLEELKQQVMEEMKQQMMEEMNQKMLEQKNELSKLKKHIMSLEEEKSQWESTVIHRQIDDAQPEGALKVLNDVDGEKIIRNESHVIDAVIERPTADSEIQPTVTSQKSIKKKQSRKLSKIEKREAKKLKKQERKKLKKRLQAAAVDQSDDLLNLKEYDDKPRNQKKMSKKDKNRSKNGIFSQSQQTQQSQLPLPHNSPDTTVNVPLPSSEINLVDLPTPRRVSDGLTTPINRPDPNEHRTGLTEMPSLIVEEIPEEEESPTMQKSQSQHNSQNLSKRMMLSPHMGGSSSPMLDLQNVVIDLNGCEQSTPHVNKTVNVMDLEFDLDVDVSVDLEHEPLKLETKYGECFTDVLTNKLWLESVVAGESELVATGALLKKFPLTEQELQMTPVAYLRHLGERSKEKLVEKSDEMRLLRRAAGSVLVEKILQM